MFAPAIAEQLDLTPGIDASGIGELRGEPDEVVFAAVLADRRVLVTENQGDLIPIANSALASTGHHGLICTSNSVFPRSNDGAVGPIVNAIRALAASDPDLKDRVVWLKPAA